MPDSTDPPVPYEDLVLCPCGCKGKTTPQHAEALRAELAARPGQQHPAPIGPPRATPTAYPPTPGQLAADASREPVDVPSMSHTERMERAWLLASQGGAAGAAERLAVLRDKSDHSLGDTAQARP